MFVLNEDSLTKLIAPMTPFYGSSSEWIQLEDGSLSTYSEIYRKQPAVRSVVDFLAGHAARMPIKLFKRKSDTDREYLRDHELQRLLSWPSGYVGRSSFWRESWLDLLIYDRLCLAKIRSKDTANPISLVRIPAQWYTPFGENYFRPDYIRITGNRSLADIPIDDVVYMHGYDPNDPRIGISPMETLRGILEEEFAGTQWRKRFWNGGAQPSMVITRPMDAPLWDGTDRDRFIESLRAATSRGRPLVLEEGMTSNPSNAFDPKTAQYVESKKLTRDEVLHTYNMPLGLFDPGTAGLNIAQYRSMLYAETLAPLLVRFVDELEKQLLTDWTPDPYGDGLYMEAMIEEKMRGNLLEQIQQLQGAVGAPFMSRDEARTYLQLPSKAEEDADKLIIPLNVSVGGEPAAARVSETLDPNATAPGKPGQASPLDAAPDKPATNEGPGPSPGPKARKMTTRQHAALAKARVRYATKAAQVIEAYGKRQRAAVLSKKDAKAIKLDRKRWDKELGDDIFKMSLVTATYFGTAVADNIGGAYDEPRTHNYLKRGAELAAADINAATEDALDEVDVSDEPTADGLSPLEGVFALLMGARALEIGESITTRAANFGIHEAGQQNDLAQKVWVTTSDHPRPAHAAMDGESANVGEPFSNGMMYPGDPSGGADEVAGCACLLDVVPAAGKSRSPDDGTTITTDDMGGQRIDIHLHMGDQPDVNVTIPERSTQVDVHVPEQKTPVVIQGSSQVDVHVPEQQVDVHVPKPTVTIVDRETAKKMRKTVHRDDTGRITGTTEEPIDE